jgi:iron complex outermembrane receptor protein
VPSITQDSADVTQTTHELRLASEDTDGFSWQVGAFFFDSELAVTTDSFASFGFVDVQDTIVVQNNDTWAVFGQGSYDVSDELTITAGVRYTDDSKDFHVQQYGQLYLDLGIPAVTPISVTDSQISWDLSANYALDEKSSVYGRVSDGFRAQTIQGRDVAFLESPSVADPETILSWEAGYKADLMSDRLRVNAAVFYYTVKDMQLSIIGGATNSNQVINADEGVGSGFEVDFEYLATENLLIMGGFAYNNTKINDSTLATATCGSGLCTVLDPLDSSGRALLDGNPFPRAPETSYNISARYSIPVNSAGEYFIYTDWSVMGDVNMPLYEAVEFKTGTQFEGGLKVGYKNFENNWEVALFGRNITNEHNVKGFVDFSNNTGFVNDPPVVGIMATYNFSE